MREGIEGLPSEEILSHTEPTNLAGMSVSRTSSAVGRSDPGKPWLSWRAAAKARLPHHSAPAET